MVDEDVAALMITNPNTLGVFEEHITEIARILHAKGALVYMDGANMNALAGISRPGDFGVDRHAPEPAQDLLDAARRRRAGIGTGGGEEAAGAVPAAAAARSMRTTGGPGITIGPNPSAACAPSTEISAFWCGRWPTSWRTAATDCNAPRIDALLNANYLRKLLEPHYEIAYHAPSMHECVFSDNRQAERGVPTGDIAKRLIDYGFHPYTVSFPLIVHGALMIEPTETESKQRAGSVRRRADLHRQGSGRRSGVGAEGAAFDAHEQVDEVKAARRPILRWKPTSTASQAAD